jgi:glycosyltransferase involved in cell wall biosynthesis
MIKINYISEISLPSNSAYAQHVLKICDTFSQTYKTNLFLFATDIQYKILKKNYLLKNDFDILPFKNKINKINFYNRLKYALWIKNNVQKKSLILSRSVLTSLVLSFWKINNFLELHHPPTGFTKVLYNFSKFFKLDSFIQYIVISKSLKNFMKLEKSVVLDDAVDISDYKIKKIKKYNYEITYVGSLFKGKGLEIIDYLSKNFPKNKFYIFGDLKTINKKDFNLNVLRSRKNLFFKGYVTYKHIPKILLSSKILLLPYQNNVYVNSQDLEVSTFMSPLKLFEYLASKKIILASRLKVYSHILKNNFNCFLISPENYPEWKCKLGKIINNLNHYSYLGRNAYQTAKKYTWKKRTDLIINYYKKKEMHNK